MTEEELSNLSDQELLVEAKKMKSTNFINAVLIGFLIGVIIYSVVKSTVGLFTLIPLFIIYKFTNASKNDETLKKVLADRGLK